MTKTIKSVFGLLIAALFVFFLVFSFGPSNYNEVLLQNFLAEKNDGAQVDLIIVLGAGLIRGGNLTDIAKERVDHALTVHELFQTDLMFSGGDTPFGTEAGAMIAYAERNGYQGPQHHEGSSTSTYENALFSDQLLDEDKIVDESVLLITSPYHSKRALATFRALMPGREVLISYPDDTVILNNSVLGRWKGLKNLIRETLATRYYSYKYGITTTNY
jgi:uncharacterized SAM-binding protein YcdF (DUF218 family)